VTYDAALAAQGFTVETLRLILWLIEEHVRLTGDYPSAPELLKKLKAPGQ
jgi:hypothetical protein